MFEKGRVMTDAKPKSQTPEARRRKRASGVVVPHAPAWHQRLAAWLIFLSMRLVTLTIRFKWDDRSDLIHRPPASPVIFCIWHNRLGLSMEAYRIFSKVRPSPGLAAMVSASKDGGFLTAVLERFRVQPVRGSSSRRGPQALRELTTWAKRGYDLAITPDGPRGPCGVVQEGVLALAQLTGLPIIAFSYDAKWKIQLKSWDRFQIPLPFTRCEMRAAKPLVVPPEATDTEREALRRQLEAALRDLARDTERRG